MKEKMKPMLIGGVIGAAAGASAAFLMEKKDTKNFVLFGGIGLAVGAVVCYFMCKDKAPASTGTTTPPSTGTTTPPATEAKTQTTTTTEVPKTEEGK